MAVWGRKAIGRYVLVKEEDPVKRGVTYESRFETAIDIPDAIELPLLTALQGLKDRIAGTQTTYIEVKGRKVIMQWKQTGSPAISVGTVITAIIAIAVIYAVYLTLTAVYQILTFLGPEVSGFIMSMLFLMGFFIVMGSFISMIMPRRRE